MDPWKLEGFAEWFVSGYCGRDLIVGQVIMNARAERSSERYIKVFRQGQPLSSNGTYIPGEILEVTLSDRNDQFVYEVQNAKFRPGGCKGKRSKKATVNLVVPEDATKDIIVVAGWAPGHTRVRLSEEFILKAPTSEKNVDPDAESEMNPNKDLEANPNTDTAFTSSEL